MASGDMTDGTSPDLEGLSAESRASLLSRLCFWWGIPVLRSFDNDVRKGCFTFDSLPRIPAREGARRACVEFDQVLAEELKRQRPSFHRAVWRYLREPFMFVIAAALLSTTLYTVCLVMLRPIIRSMHGELPLSTGLTWLCVMTATGAISGAMQQHSMHQSNWMGRRLWCAVVTNLFAKPARLDETAFEERSESEIISLIGDDASLLPYISSVLTFMVAAPFQYVVAAIVASYFLGVAFLAGVAVSVLLFVISDIAAQAYKKTVAMKHKHSDVRLMVVNKTLQGIRSVKLCGWEAALERRTSCGAGGGRIAAPRRAEQGGGADPIGHFEESCSCQFKFSVHPLALAGRKPSLSRAGAFSGMWTRQDRAWPMSP